MSEIKSLSEMMDLTFTDFPEDDFLYQDYIYKFDVSGENDYGESFMMFMSKFDNYE